MKKILAGLTLFLGLVFAEVASADSSATLFLEGYVEEICELYVIPVIGAATTLDVVGGETQRNIASVEESFNGDNGYTISIGSINSGELTHSNATNSAPYTIEYNGGAATPPGPAATPVVVKTAPAGAPVSSLANAVDINITGDPTLPSGVYTDTLIFTITAL